MVQTVAVARALELFIATLPQLFKALKARKRVFSAVKHAEDYGQSGPKTL